MRSLSLRASFAVAFVSASIIVFASRGLANELGKPAPLQEFFQQEFNKRLVEAFNKRPFENGFKSDILQKVRSEDKDAVSRSIVSLSPVSEFKLEARTDGIYGVDSKGAVVIVLQQFVATPAKFLINGHIWTPPQSGSVFKSLDSVFRAERNVKKSASIDLLLPEAVAAEARTTENTSKLLAFVAGSYSAPRAMPIGTFLSESKVREYLDQGYFFKGVTWAEEWNRAKEIATNSGKRVDCSADGKEASGYAVIKDDRFKFRSLADGTVILQAEGRPYSFKFPASTGSIQALFTLDRLLSLANDPKPEDQFDRRFELNFRIRGREEMCREIRAYGAFLTSDELCKQLADDGPYSEQTLKKNAALYKKLVPLINATKAELSKLQIVSDHRDGALLCLNPDCSETAKDEGYVIPSASDRKNVEAALSFKSKNPNSKARIEFACTIKNETCGSFNLIGRETLDQYEREEALRLLRLATLGSDEKRERMRDPTTLVRPLSGLGACCGELTCREMMLKENVRLKNSSGSKTER